jgi:methyl-accepting chemotaxis protein
MYTQNTSSLYGKLLRSMLVPIAVTIAMLVSFGAWFAVRQAQESAYTLAQEKAYHYAYQIQSELSSAYESAYIVARSIEALKTRGITNRAAVNDILYQALLQYPLSVGTYNIWSPNAFDGNDAAFANTPLHDSTGRYIPYWQRSSGTPRLDPLTDYDTYLDPIIKSNKETILDPYFYEIGGKPRLITSFFMPLRYNGKVVGLSGIDFTLNGLDKLMEEARFYDNGFAYLVANNGTIVTHRVKTYIHKDIAVEDTTVNFQQERAAIANGTFFQSEKNGMLRLYVPIKIGNTGTPWSVVLRVPMSEVFASARQLIWTMTILGVVACAVIVWRLRAIARKTAEPIHTIADAANTVAQGNTDIQVQIHTNDEIESLAVNFNAMTAQIRKTLEEVITERESVQRKVDEATAELAAQKYALESAVETMLATMENFANGDLTVQLQADRSANVNLVRLFAGFNEAVSAVRSMASAVVQAVEKTSDIATQIGTATEELSASAEAQSAQAATVAHTVEVNAREISSVSERTVLMANIAKTSGHDAETGGNIMQQTLDKITRIASVVQDSASVVQRLGDSSQQIGEIVAVIEEIADQTNLLALNAAIEAARAGEQGRGFAVVADEVRKLAERTSKSTKEIHATIRLIQQETEHAVHGIQRGMREAEEGIALADRAGSALQGIVEGAQKVEQMVIDIAQTSRRQSQASTDISSHVAEISSAAAQTATTIHDVASSTEELNLMTRRLRTLVRKFKI